MSNSPIKMPSNGARISVNADGVLHVPNNPIVPFIEGDGIGGDIAPVMRRVVNAAIAHAYGTQRQLHWMEIFCGEKAADLYDGEWYPSETLDAIKEFTLAVKGPQTLPIGEGFRSLAVALRQEFDLYANVRPVRWLQGMPSPLRAPAAIDAVIFRETSEDIYAGIEWAASSRQAEKLIDFLRDEMGVKKIRHADECGIGIKPISAEGSRRLIRRAIQYALDHDLPSVMLVHKGDVLKHTEGAFRRWGFKLAETEFSAQPSADLSSLQILNPSSGRNLQIREIFSDALLPRMMTAPQDFSVIATMNLNGDYIADALVAMIGATGIVPSANIGDGIALFEVTHGAAPRYAGSNSANPTSIILAAEMMLRHIGWREAAEFILRGLQGAMTNGIYTRDLASKFSGITPTGCREFGNAIIAHMN